MRLNSNKVAEWKADRRRQSRQHPADDLIGPHRRGRGVSFSRGDHYRRKNNGTALRTFRAIKERTGNYNPAPRDRLFVVWGWEPGHRGDFLPSWRICTPGYGDVEHACGDAWMRFLAFWRGLAHAIARWDRSGRPGPVFSHLTPDEQDWISA